MKIVDRGAKLLDEIEPDWYEKIDLERLDLGDSCNCVLGQLYQVEHPRIRDKVASYERKGKELGIDPWSAQAGRLGFIEYGRARYSNMTAAWRRAILRRRSA